MSNVKIVSGASNVPDAECVSVGAWKNQHLVDQSLENPERDPYRVTMLCTFKVLHKENVDRLKEVVTQGGDARDTFIVARINIYGDANPRIPMQGELVKNLVVLPATTKDGSPVMITKGALAGRQAMNARIQEFYPIAAVEELDLDDLLSGASEEASISTPSGEATEA